MGYDTRHDTGDTHRSWPGWPPGSRRPPGRAPAPPATATAAARLPPGRRGRGRPPGAAWPRAAPRRSAALPAPARVTRTWGRAGPAPPHVLRPPLSAPLRLPPRPPPPVLPRGLLYCPRPPCTCPGAWHRPAHPMHPPPPQLTCTLPVLPAPARSPRHHPGAPCPSPCTCLSTPCPAAAPLPLPWCHPCAIPLAPAWRCPLRHSGAPCPPLVPLLCPSPLTLAPASFTHQIPSLPT